MTLREVADRVMELYPPALRRGQQADRDRVEFHAELILRLAGRGARCMDVGGGLGFLSPLLAACGCSQVLVDDFRDLVNASHPIEVLGVHRQLGVDVVRVDASSDRFLPPIGEFDLISSFDSIEHWHRSPKQSLHRMRDALKPGGWLVIGVPNCVNLRKRLTVPFGAGKWSSMSTWYEQPEFRGHVREPDIGDLRYIADDLGLVTPRVFGRNWAARANSRAVIRALAPLADPLLRLRPSLCSDICLLGRRAPR